MNNHQQEKDKKPSSPIASVRKAIHAISKIIKRGSKSRKDSNDYGDRKVFEDKEHKLKLSPSTGLVEQPYFHGIMPREEIQYFLQNEGDFLVRRTKHGNDDNFVISVLWEDKPRHFIMVPIPTKGLWTLETYSFKSIPELISYYYTFDEQVTESSGAHLKTPKVKQIWQLNNDDLKRDKLLGEGNFGAVCKGTYTNPVTKIVIEVAIKTCHESMEAEEKNKFLGEARIMRHYNHPNIVRVYGVACEKEPMMIVLEYVDGGSLQSFLRTSETTKRTKLKFIVDCSKGMEYLETKECIHRDLASRNCLIDKRTNTVKISDFGLSREGSTYKIQTLNRPLPIKWCAIETLESKIYTHKTDVWSFGILMWEIFSNGCEPYEDMDNKQTHRFLKDGKRLSVPEEMSPAIASVMQTCWNVDADLRPHFSRIKLDLLKLCGDS